MTHAFGKYLTPLMTCAVLCALAAPVFAQELVFVDGLDEGFQRIGLDGTGQARFGSGLNHAFYVAIRGDGTLFASEFGAGDIERFDRNGNSLGIFATGLSAPNGAPPNALAFDSANNVYVGQTGGANSILKYSPDGSSRSFFGLPGAAVAVDTSDNVFIGALNRLYKYSPTGVKLAETTSFSGNVSGLALDSGGIVYAAVGNQIRRFSSAGADLGLWVTTPNNVFDLTFDPAGNLYASSPADTSIFKFSPSGSLLATLDTGIRTPYGLRYRGAVPGPGALAVALAGMMPGAALLARRRAARGPKPTSSKEERG